MSLLRNPKFPYIRKNPLLERILSQKNPGLARKLLIAPAPHIAGVESILQRRLVTNILWHIDPLLGNVRNTRGQQYRSSVFCGPHTDRWYVTHAKHIFLCAVTSHNNREAVFFMRSALRILTRDICFLWSLTRVSNESMLVARRLEDWNWEFRTELREWEYDDV
jgi:hypothetical protein